ncbi:unnamed protein product [Heligmosomoides polygyrus]|uniref:Reverse transcriptase domain-containing protein n=1 Tax=Heligmosomoides polygyrus TaxID=6339 RepID=A0A183FGC7_HELPZ|nr:unnamed protein product [Heligmosomoides polygyrus]
MDAISRDLQKPAPWTLLYADDRQVQAWCDRLAAFGLKLNTGSIEINGTALSYHDR